MECKADTVENKLDEIQNPIAALLALEDAHGNRVDLLIGLRGLDRTALQRSIVVPFQGATLTVLGRETREQLESALKGFHSGV
jgi:hypothetical protein